MNPEIRYAKSGDVHIAYQVFGNGPQNLVIIPDFISHVEHVWDSPDQAAWFNHLARRTRIVMFDKRGTGLSDRLGQLPNLDQRMDDARAVMDAAGVERAAIMGVSEGGSLAALFAASHPERCSALILYGSFARFSDWFPTKQKFDGFLSCTAGPRTPLRNASTAARQATKTAGLDTILSKMDAASRDATSLSKHRSRIKASAIKEQLL